MLTLAPLPAWSALFHALLRRSSTEDDPTAPWRRTGEVAGLLSRSAWSLALIALWRQRSVGLRPIKVWIPDFFCNTSLQALRATGATLVFYPIGAELAPEFAACRTLAHADPPDLFLLVHYFGKPTPTAPARDFCARHGAWLIEDAAQVLRPVVGIGNHGDFVLYSPHKHLPIPEGAVLVVRPDGPGQIVADGAVPFGLPNDWAGQLHALQDRLGLLGLRLRSRTCVWFAKRVLQKLGVRRLDRSLTPFAESATPMPSDPMSLGLAAPSRLASNLLMGLTSVDLGDIARQRRRRQLLWDNLLLEDETLRSNPLAVAERPEAREWTPYLGAYRIDPAVAETAYHRWQRYGIPANTWPDLPPEITAHRECHAGAWKLRHSRLYLAVHQSLRVRKIIASVRRPRTWSDRAPSLAVTWNMATRAQWEHWMADVGRSSLLQSWSYGDAKATYEGWRVRRGIFSRGDEPIAIAQVLEKRIGGLARVVRINRGPVFLNGCSHLEQEAVWREVSRLGSARHGRLLTVAPELALSGSSLRLLEELGFRQFSPRAWESVWVDLGLELDIMRKRLTGKWRNMLTFAEKADLQLEIGDDDRLVDWMMARYQELMASQQFVGPSVGLLMALRQHTTATEPFLVLRARHEGEVIAGICLACHGCASTYLLGWNCPKGRILKANQFLLWHAIIHLKHRGLRWFDLGGIDEDSTPGISSFKLGMNGERYELVGEYWR